MYASSQSDSLKALPSGRVYEFECCCWHSAACTTMHACAVRCEIASVHLKIGTGIAGSVSAGPALEVSVNGLDCH